MESTSTIQTAPEWPDVAPQEPAESPTLKSWKRLYMTGPGPDDFWGAQEDAWEKLISQISRSWSLSLYIYTYLLISSDFIIFYLWHTTNVYNNVYYDYIHRTVYIFANKFQENSQWLPKVLAPDPFLGRRSGTLERGWCDWSAWPQRLSGQNLADWWFCLTRWSFLWSMNGKNHKKLGMLTSSGDVFIAIANSIYIMLVKQ